jgi:uncharacterized membrane protein YcaP (DUF421 family)
MMFLELGLSLAKGWWPSIDPVLDSRPVVIVEDGRVMNERMAHERVDLSDVLTAARELHGLKGLDEIRYAVLERSGGISIVPRNG